MSSFLFTLEDYHAIKQASIRLDGITVLAGPNGSGKSTVARWINTVVSLLNYYDSYVIDEAFGDYSDIEDSISRGSTIALPTRLEWNRIVRHESMPVELEEMKGYMESLIQKLMTVFEKKLSPDLFMRHYARLCAAYALERLDDESLDSFLSRLSAKLLSESERIYQNTVSRLNRHSLKNLKGVLDYVMDPSIDSWPNHIRFSEENADLLGDKEFLRPLTLTRSMYIDTQKIADIVTPFSRNSFHHLIHNSSPVRASKYAMGLARQIKRLIGGDVVVEKDSNTPIYRQDDLHFIREGVFNILLKGAATGVISFSYILRLLENGWIAKDTLLIIDEPEAHLHPRWIVEYARVLVLIQRYVGTKILISTHSPDMVAAIRSISEREEVLGNTCFYLAERDEEIDKYTYRFLDHEIGPIFDSFNIAADRIDMYGVEE